MEPYESSLQSDGTTFPPVTPEVPPPPGVEAVSVPELGAEEVGEQPAAVAEAG